MNGSGIPKLTGLPRASLRAKRVGASQSGLPSHSQYYEHNIVPANTSLRYKILYDLVLETIRGSLPELDPENLEFVFPPHDSAPKSNFYTYGQA